jgi:hypothetical protein
MLGMTMPQRKPRPGDAGFVSELPSPCDGIPSWSCFSLSTRSPRSQGGHGIAVANGLESEGERQAACRAWSTEAESLSPVRVEEETTMLVKSIMTSDVKSCSADSAVAAAARIMSNRDCGIVPVVDAQQKLLGAITDRDVCLAVATRVPDSRGAGGPRRHDEKDLHVIARR